ncbi:annexin A13-like [Ruditapes philippinarum]|uniref:annexin A13-like n=1 Tax=Ruditapes philippinarum TaxID=129788 RepID=UPI00295C2F48|nr:annexin A13-like [Ruditapes philippinarum]
MALRYFQGTIVAQECRLDVEAAAKKLRKAMKGLGTDEKAIIEVLGSHSNHELQLIKEFYNQHFLRVLGKDIQDELSGHFEKLCLYLLLPRPHFQAYCLHQAMDGLGTDETTLIEILCTCTNQEIAEIKDAYRERFKKELEADLEGDTSGHFRCVLVGIVQGNRSEEQVIDQALVNTDVEELLKAGVKKIGTDESVFNRILVRRSVPHLQAVFDAYKLKDKQDILAAIHSETSGHLRETYLAIARYVIDPIDYFAECFYKCMKGAGTDDERLMQLVVNHGEIDLRDIAEAYLKKYHKGLSRAIQDDTSGDYRKLLVRLTNINVIQQPPVEQFLKSLPTDLQPPVTQDTINDSTDVQDTKK